jgi:hypothetical protein
MQLVKSVWSFESSSRPSQRREGWRAQLISVCGLWLLLSAGSALPLLAQAKLPPTEAKSLSGKEVKVPAPDRLTLLVAGFTKASSAADGAWWKKAAPICKQNPGLACYQVAVLEDAPRFVRPMIVGSMRHGTPPEQQDNFLTSFENEKAWKQALSYSVADNAYLALVDSSGTILWQQTGGKEAGDLSGLEQALQARNGK